MIKFSILAIGNRSYLLFFASSNPFGRFSSQPLAVSLYAGAYQYSAESLRTLNRSAYRVLPVQRSISTLPHKLGALVSLDALVFLIVGDCRVPPWVSPPFSAV